MGESIIQPWVDEQIARHAGDTFADLVALLDAHRAASYDTEHEFLDAWLETQWSYWALDARCEDEGQRERLDQMAVTCGFVMLG